MMNDSQNLQIGDQELYAAHWAAYHMKSAMLREFLEKFTVSAGSDMERRMQFYAFHDHVLKLRDDPSDHVFRRFMEIFNELLNIWELHDRVNVYHFSRIRQLTLMQYGLYKLKGFLKLGTGVKPPRNPLELDKSLPTVFDSSLYEQYIKEIFHTYTPRTGLLSAVEQAYARHFKNALLDIYKAPSIIDKMQLFVLFHNYPIDTYVREVTLLMRGIENEVMFIPEMPSVASSAPPTSAVKAKKTSVTENAWTEEQKGRNGPYAATSSSANGTQTSVTPSKQGSASANTIASSDSQATQEQSPAPKRRSKRGKGPATESVPEMNNLPIGDRAEQLRTIREHAKAKNASKDPLTEAMGLSNTQSQSSFENSPTPTSEAKKKAIELAPKRKLRSDPPIEKAPSKPVEAPKTTTAAPAVPSRQLRSAGVPAELALPMQGKLKPTLREETKETLKEETKEVPATPPRSAKYSAKATPTSHPAEQANSGGKHKRGRKRPISAPRENASTVVFTDSEDEPVTPKKHARKAPSPAKPKQTTPIRQATRQAVESISSTSSEEEDSPKRNRTAMPYYNKKKFEPLPKEDPQPGPAVMEHAVGKRLKWSFDEEEALIAGIAKHGEGNWRQILDDPEFSGRFRGRTNVNLKDKCRNLKDRGAL